MIKLKLRRNFAYILAYYISWYIRKIVNIIIDQTFNSYLSYINLYLMVLAETIGGLSLFLYQNSSYNQRKQTKYFNIDLIYNNQKDKIGDKKIKRFFLIFLAGFFDFYPFIIDTLYIPKIEPNLPATIEPRLECIQTVISSILCAYSINFKIKKHHKVSIIIISLCVLFTLIFEIIFKEENISIGRFLLVRFLLLYTIIGISFNNCIEKYLVDTNYINPFKILMSEGIFEIIMAILISIGKDPFKDMINLYNEISVGKFVLLIFLLFIYFLLSILVNGYKIYGNTIYTPMDLALSDYLLNPFFNIYYFFTNNEFNNNYFYFIISEIICIIAVFFGCVFNEYIVLFFCNLEYETKDIIMERSIELENRALLDIEEREEKGNDNNND